MRKTSSEWAAIAAERLEAPRPLNCFLFRARLWRIQRLESRSWRRVRSIQSTRFARTDRSHNPATLFRQRRRTRRLERSEVRRREETSSHTAPREAEIRKTDR